MAYAIADGLSRSEGAAFPAPSGSHVIYEGTVVAEIRTVLAYRANPTADSLLILRALVSVPLERVLPYGAAFMEPVKNWSMPLRVTLSASPVLGAKQVGWLALGERKQWPLFAADAADPDAASTGRRGPSRAS